MSTGSGDAAHATRSQAPTTARHFWIPNGLGLAAAAQSVILRGASPWGFAGALLFLVAGYTAGRHLSRAAQPSRLPDDDHAVVDASGLREICYASLDVWARQIEGARKSADEAVLRLTQLFEATVGKLEASMQAIRKALAELDGERGVMATVEHGEAELRSALESLHQVERHKDAQVTLHARGLRTMAAEVHSIAMQSRLLSFNAAVEAAHAGAAAGGFAVVAGEMRQLAAVSGETAERMVKTAETINATLENTNRGDKSALDAEASVMTEAEAAIRSVTARFDGMTRVLAESVSVMERQTEAVHREISDALVAMQFQDRVSQIQQHVVNSLGDLRSTLGAGARIPDLHAWQSALAREFSTIEEFDNLPAAHPARAQRHTSETTTFF